MQLGRGEDVFRCLGVLQVEVEGVFDDLGGECEGESLAVGAEDAVVGSVCDVA